MEKVSYIFNNVKNWLPRLVQWREQHIKERRFILMLSFVVGIGTALAALPDAELFETLKTIRGVGDKVANCICLFSYGRMSAAPVDTWIHKIIAREYGGRNPFPAYGEYAGILQQFAFYYAIAHKERFAGM